MSDMLRLETEQYVVDRGATRRDALRRPPNPRLVLDLHDTVCSQVIPRLCQALGRNLAKPAHPLLAEANRPFGQIDIASLADSLFSDRLPEAFIALDAYRDNGRSLESIYLHLLAPTACYMHKLWAEDLAGLAETSLALCHLQKILRHYASEFYGKASRHETGLRALLVSPSVDGTNAALPVFGLLLLSEFFRRDGWHTWVERSLSVSSARDTVLSEWFDLVEILATSDKELDAIATVIRAIRRQSPNSSIGVVVCGEMFRENPKFVGLVGADRMASDPLSSLLQAKQFVTHPTPRRRLS